MFEIMDTQGQEAVIKGLRVLCLCGDGDNAGLDGLLAAAQRNLGWQVDMLRPDISQFCERQAFESDGGAVAEIDALNGHW